MIPVMDLIKSIKSLTIGRSIRTTFLILVILSTGFYVSGQVKFTTAVNSKAIGRGDYLQIEFYVENARQIDQMAPPEFPGFQIVQGPIQSSGMSIINGNMSQYKSLSFVLQPTKTGKFTIGGASATVDGKHMQSNSVTITVSASSTGAGGGSNPGSQPVNPFPSNAFPPMNWPSDPFGMGSPMDVDKDIVLRPGESIKDKIKKGLFLKVLVDKTTCYVGEPIVATYKLYSRLASESKVTKHPSLNGFSVYDMVDPNSDASSVERLNGKAYTVHVIRKTQLIPLQPGTIDLDPVEVENTVHFVKGTKQQDQRHSSNPMKDFYDQLNDENLGPEVDESVTLDTKPVTITVKPLPEENKPAVYTGAVGSFTIQTSLANRNISAQDEATLHVVVRGKGNLPVVTAPSIAWPAGVEAFDPTAKEDINKMVAPMSGAKSFDYVFTPRDPGHYVIPAVSFPYFDPITQSYKTASSEPIDFQVMAGVKKKQSAPGAVTPVTAPVQEQPGQLKKLIQDHLEWIFAVLILSVLAVYLWRQNIRLKKKEQEQKEEAARKAAEEKLAEEKARESLAAAALAAGPPVDHLLEVRQLFEQGDYKGFYRELNRAVWKALSQKLELPASELNKLNITRRLDALGWDRQDILSLEHILNECEMNLYTPAYDTYNMQMLLRQAEPVMNKLA
ncbi:MAG TPA: BatD family protein [Puia sp.]|nr:BatD family protein [Puia sp.]